MNHKYEPKYLKAMLELCELVNRFGSKLHENDPEDCRMVIPFTDLFSMYKAIDEPLNDLLFSCRTSYYIEFTGNVLDPNQARPLPIVLIKPIADIRRAIYRELPTYGAADESLQNGCL